MCRIYNIRGLRAGAYRGQEIDDRFPPLGCFDCVKVRRHRVKNLLVTLCSLRFSTLLDRSCTSNGTSCEFTRRAVRLPRRGSAGNIPAKLILAASPRNDVIRHPACFYVASIALRGADYRGVKIASYLRRIRIKKIRRGKYRVNCAHFRRITVAGVTK